MRRASMTPFKNYGFGPVFWGVETELENLADLFDRPLLAAKSQNASDFKETEQAYVMSLDMPGIKKDDLEIQVEDGHIHISATRLRPLSENNKEEKITKVSRLPKLADSSKIKAHYEDGVLYLFINKSEEAKPRKVDLSNSLDDKELKLLLEAI